MFFNNIDPVLFRLGFLEIRFYGMVYSFGFLTIYLALNHYIKKGVLKLSRRMLDKYIFYLIIYVVVSARLMHVLIADPSFYFNNLIEILKIWNGGMSFHGGLIGCLAYSYYFFKKRDISFFKVADLIVVPSTLILIVGRVANYINGELYGKVTDVWWCVKFQFVDGCRHATQLYSAFSRLIIFFIILFLSKKRLKEGVLFWIFILLMGIERVIVDFFRDDIRLIGLTIGQHFSIVMIIFACYFLFKKY